MIGRNVCGKERDARFLAGILILLGAILYGGGGMVLVWIIGALGVYLFLTALYSYCPVNKALSRNSCSLLDRVPLVE